MKLFLLRREVLKLIAFILYHVIAFGVKVALSIDLFQKIAWQRVIQLISQINMNFNLFTNNDVINDFTCARSSNECVGKQR